jgi:hypothetical protein
MTRKILFVFDDHDLSVELRTVIDLLTGLPADQRFSIDIAWRGSPGLLGIAPRYRGFRFDLTEGGVPVIDHYGEIWCFGVAAVESAAAAAAHPLAPDDRELHELAGWMERRRGGVFATAGPTGFGGVLCHRIPRVRSMRRWFDPPGRNEPWFDTLRGGRGDAIPQPIECVTFPRGWTGPGPHAVLTHPDGRLGAINVMPDDDAEGRCTEEAEINLAAYYSFRGGLFGMKREYPRGRNGQTRPAVIAYGNAVATGSTPARRFPMISAYDGWQAGLGRVLVDSSNTHWADNWTSGIRQENGTNWRKIRQYYINVAQWLWPDIAEPGTMPA